MQNPKNIWVFHAWLTAAMYLFYAYLWVDEIFLYSGKAGWRGFQLFTFTTLTAPFYAVYHLIILFMALSRKDRQLLKVGLLGILLCIIHVIAVFSGVWH